MVTHQFDVALHVKETAHVEMKESTGVGGGGALDLHQTTRDNKQFAGRHMVLI